MESLGVMYICGTRLCPRINTIHMQSRFPQANVGCLFDPVLLPQEAVATGAGRVLLARTDSDTGLSLKANRSYKDAIWSPWGNDNDQHKHQGMTRND